jgi:sec-independent protein translocase protein TatA
MFGLGTQELIVIAVIVAVVFGINKLPSIGKDLGAGIREFKKAAKELVHHEEEE